MLISPYASCRRLDRLLDTRRAVSVVDDYNPSDEKQWPMTATISLFLYTESLLLMHVASRSPRGVLPGRLRSGKMRAPSSRCGPHTRGRALPASAARTGGVSTEIASRYRF
eukprot:5135404-Pleurochrysis_carterae.AAC.1